MKGIQNKYFKLAELLVEILVESEQYSDIDVKIPQRLVERTARYLQDAFESGEEVPDEEGRLYNVYLIENYGGLITSYLDNKLEKQNNDKA